MNVFENYFGQEVLFAKPKQIDYYISYDGMIYLDCTSKFIENYEFGFKNLNSDLYLENKFEQFRQDTTLGKEFKVPLIYILFSQHVEKLNGLHSNLIQYRVLFKKNFRDQAKYPNEIYDAKRVYFQLDPEEDPMSYIFEYFNEHLSIYLAKTLDLLCLDLNEHHKSENISFKDYKILKKHEKFSVGDEFIKSKEKKYFFKIYVTYDVRGVIDYTKEYDYPLSAIHTVFDEISKTVCEDKKKIEKDVKLSSGLFVSL